MRLTGLALGFAAFIAKRRKNLRAGESQKCVRLTGLEPARRETLDPKSSASTNSATGANVGAKVMKAEDNTK